jgi:succinate dehydrogenase / fumarate reductase flavoprotein subunit
MAELHAKEAPDRILELEQWGAVFDRTPEGKISQREFGGHQCTRLAHVGDRTGLEIIRTMQDKAVAENIPVYMETTITRLIVNDGRVVGAFGYIRQTGKFIAFRTKAIVLATGGIGRLFKVTSNSWESTGDGVMLAYEAGAELMDIEFVQFHPTGMVWPPGVRGLLVTEGVRGEGGVLKNSKGERFMPNYIPSDYDLKGKPPELLPRDMVARAIYTEVKEGRGTPHGAVYLDVTHRGAAYIRRRLPAMYDQFISLGNVDITKDPMEVYPTIHYAMGGIWVDADSAATSVPGLYAAGEVAAGLHGANRLGGNSLSDILVFGRRAGLGASEYARTVSHSVLDERQIAEEQEVLLAPLTREGIENPFTLQRELQECMQQHAGIVRDEDGLRTGLEKVLALQSRVEKIRVDGDRVYNPGWHTARDVRFMVKTAEAILRCAFARKESRGAHYRTDFPKKSEEWAEKNNFICSKDGQMSLFQRPKPPIPPELQAVLKELA